MKIIYLTLSLILFINCASFNQTTIQENKTKVSNADTNIKSDTINKTKVVLPVTIENIHEVDSSIFEIYIVPILSIFAGILGVLLGWWLSKNNFNQTKFEENFFKLLDTQDAILNNIKYHIHLKSNEPEEFYTGRNFFFVMMKQLKHLYNHQNSLLEITDGTNDHMISVYELHNKIKQFRKSSPIHSLDTISSPKSKFILSKYCYSYFFDKFYNEVGHYFRHLYHILKYIDEYEMKIEKFGKAKHYTDLIQARMSAGELCLLFYNSLIFPEMKKYVDKYELTENLAIEDLMEESHKEFVPFRMKSRKEHTEGLFEFDNKNDSEMNQD